jgi:hypothetical protein
MKWIIAGILGGGIGAAVWTGVGYYANAEIGWIAWGIGALVGFCVQSAARESTERWVTGVGAALIAVVSVVAGKYMVVELLFSDADMSVELTQADMISGLASDIVEQRSEAGQEISWPAGVDPEEAYEQHEFPVDIWQQAVAQWESFEPEDQARRLAERQQQVAAIVAVSAEEWKQQVFLGSFSPYDVLWFVLATMTAYKLGSARGECIGSCEPAQTV